MSRSRILWDKQGLLAEYEDDVLIYLRPGALDGINDAGPQIMRDISPYKSMINGQMISSRSQHRTHLRDHGCVEVGNDVSHLTPKPKPQSTARKESLHRMLSDVGERDIKQIVNRTIKEIS